MSSSAAVAPITPVTPDTSEARDPRDAPASPVREFVARAVPVLGGLVEPRPEGALEALLPPDLAAATGEAAAGGVVGLVFDPDRAARPPADGLPAAPGDPLDQGAPLLVTVGSPLLEELLARTAGIGLATRWFVNDLPWPARPADVVDPAHWGVRLVDVRVERLDAFPSTFACLYLACAVLVSIASDERHEALHTIVVDLRTGQPAPWEWERWERLRLETTPTFAAGRNALPTTAEVQEGWARAAALLERRLAGTLASYQRQAARRQELDQARARSYFEENEADLRRRLDRARAAAAAGGAPGAATADAAPDGASPGGAAPEALQRLRSLEQKLAANALEWERRQADIEAKHRLRVSFTLVNAALIVQPKLRARVRLSNRYASAEWPLTFDPLAGHLELPVCSHCRDAVDAVLVCAGGGHLLCPRCAVACSACRRRYCPACAAGALRPCAVCRRLVCSHSRVRCRRCGAETCPEHQGACHAPALAGTGAAPPATPAVAPAAATNELAAGAGGSGGPGGPRGAPGAPAAPTAPAPGAPAPAVVEADDTDHVVSPAGAAPARAAPAPAGGRTGPPGPARATDKRRQTAAGRGVSTPSGRATRAAAPESGAAASPPAPLSARLSRGDRLRLAGRLYQRLREFAFGPVGASAYQAALKQAFGASPAPPGTSSRIDFDDWYLFEGGSGHWSTVGLFIYTHRDLTADELALLHAWYTTRRRAYRVRAAGPGSLDLVDVASGARRTVREAHLVPLPYLGAGETVEARVLPAGGDTWFLSDAVFVARRG